MNGRCMNEDDIINQNNKLHACDKLVATVFLVVY